MRLRQLITRLHALWLSSSGASRGTGVVRRARRDRACHRRRGRVGSQPADVVAGPGEVRGAGRHAAVRPVNRRLRLNAYGQIMARACPAQHRRDAVRRRDASPRCRIPTPDGFGSRFCTRWRVGMYPEQLRRFRDRRRESRFDLFQGPAHEITQRVLGGQSDIAITSPRPECARLRLAPAVCRTAVPRRPAPGTGWRARARVRLSAAAGEPFVALAGSPDCASSPTTFAPRRASIPTSCSRRPRFPRWRAWSRRDLVSPWFRCPAMAPVNPRVVHVPLVNARAKREVGLVWDSDRPLSPPAERFVNFPQAAHRAFARCSTDDTP